MRSRKFSWFTVKIKLCFLRTRAFLKDMKNYAFPWDSLTIAPRNLQKTLVMYRETCYSRQEQSLRTRIQLGHASCCSKFYTAVRFLSWHSCSWNPRICHNQCSGSRACGTCFLQVLASFLQSTHFCCTLGIRRVFLQAHCRALQPREDANQWSRVHARYFLLPRKPLIPWQARKWDCDQSGWFVNRRLI